MGVGVRLFWGKGEEWFFGGDWGDSGYCGDWDGAGRRELVDGMGMMVLGRGGWVDVGGLGLGVGGRGVCWEGRVREGCVRGICWLYGFFRGWWWWCGGRGRQREAYRGDGCETRSGYGVQTP